MLDRDPGVQTGQHRVGEASASLFGQFPRRERHRNPEIDIRIELFYAFGSDADELIVIAVELNRAVENASVGTEEPFPQRRAQHHHALIAGPIFFRVEEPAGNGINAERRKESCRNSTRLQTFGHTHATEIEIAGRESCGRLEQVGLAAVINVLWCRNLRAWKVQLRQLIVDHDDAIGICDRKFAQQHGVDDRECCGCCGNAERQRKHCDRRKSLPPQQPPPPVSQIFE